MVEIEAVCRAVPDRRPARPGRKLAAAPSRSILFAALSRLLFTFAAAIAFAFNDGDVGVVGETIEETDDAGGVGKHDVPVFKRAVGSDDDRAALVASVDDLVEQIGGVAVVGEIANFVDAKQRRPGVLFEPAAQ